jgi:CO dehydrogenase maturation factor
MTKVVAVSGKGGVGKTSLSALMVRELRKDPGKRILAVDGDPAVGFSAALGVEVKKTLDQIRTEVVASGKTGRAALLRRLEYELADALTEERGFAFLAIGRSEGKGCYCKINELLKQMIADLVPSFDCIVIDGEAGVEQINRRVMEQVTHLLLVSDASKKGVHVAKTIFDVAGRSMRYEKAGLIFNRLKSDGDVAGADTGPLQVIGKLPESDGIRVSDIQGKSLLEFPEDGVTQELSRVLRSFLNG